MKKKKEGKSLKKVELGIVTWFKLKRMYDAVKNEALALKRDGKNFRYQPVVWAEHYLYGYRKDNSWRGKPTDNLIWALLKMKIMGVWFDFSYSNEFGIYFKINLVELEKNIKNSKNNVAAL